jgi:hypothetical protein
MYGPLNGVRAALVVAAFVTAIISALLGHGVAAGYLLGAVAVHGIGWRYLLPAAPRLSRSSTCRG